MAGPKGREWRAASNHALKVAFQEVEAADIAAILASELRSAEADDVRFVVGNIASSLADKFEQVDERFDRAHFFAMCGLSERDAKVLRQEVPKQKKTR